MNFPKILRDHSNINIYLDEKELVNLNSQLTLKQRATLITEKHFIKVGISTGREFFNSLFNEMNIDKTLKCSMVTTPKLLDFFHNEECIILIFEKIEGITLGSHRNDFTLQLDIAFNELFNVIKNIAEIKNYPKNIDVLNRDMKAANYFEKIYKRLDMETRGALECLIGKLHQNPYLVFSHGDLIPTNIIKTKRSYYIIDWEWASLRPSTYDAALFILFSSCPLDGVRKIEKLFRYWDPMELYRDAIIISAREIKNWLDVKDSTIKEKYIKIWLKTLKKATRWLMSH
ncbi:phosphotransferase [Pseudogracilibacillus auburnensis]|uniref:Choline/ethanolamine kinase n=1 Tax=Pseudogracilibacillus auburnensis TaxID=1494959 RepID=A0A2V3VVR7_9BACI|nr:phosphotransferase [Pseudogracilibacillus auburnensis]PXW84848.1 choline/ethanolamine kinase [Pseudogracilibacillus auburnensis]